MEEKLVNVIKEISDQKRISCLEGLEARIVRDSVFDILNNTENCIVVYYPLKGEHNKAAHISEQINGCEYHFVYINTAHDKEKQAFAAAHELGHIWKIDELVIKRLNDDLEDRREEIINRFAAEFMMPEEEFKKISSFKASTKIKDKRILINDMLEVIVFLMYYFFQPCSAVILRFIELGLLNEQDGNKLLKIVEEDPGRIQNLIITEQYPNIGRPDYSRSIKDIREMVLKAESQGTALSSQIELLKKEFEIADEKQGSDMKEDEEISYEP